MKWIIKKAKAITRQIRKFFVLFCFGFSEVLYGLYIGNHLHYLDLPRVTSYPPDTGIAYDFYGYSDTPWFTAVVFLIGIAALISIFYNSLKLRLISNFCTFVIYCTLSASFFARAQLSGRTNIAWIFILALALLAFDELLWGRKQ